jgi:hypothetical protein
LTFFQAHPRPTAVLIDELNAGGLDCMSNFFRSYFSPSEFTIY